MVLATDDGGRTATVRTEAGRIVTVVGAEGGTGAVTSVDRTYTVGARYEFHPLNDSDPYRDNACTATRALGGQPDSRQAGEGIADRLALGLAGWLGLAALTALLVAGIVTVRHQGIRRRESH